MTSQAYSAAPRDNSNLRTTSMLTTEALKSLTMSGKQSSNRAYSHQILRSSLWSTSKRGSNYHINGISRTNSYWPHLTNTSDKAHTRTLARESLTSLALVAPLSHMAWCRPTPPMKAVSSLRVALATLVWTMLVRTASEMWMWIVVYSRLSSTAPWRETEMNKTSKDS